MDFKEFLKRRVLYFLLIQAGITISVGIIGLISPPTKGLSPIAFFMPFVYAFFCVLPSFVTYSGKELSIKQMIVRKVIAFFMIEAIALLISCLLGAIINTFMLISIAVSVACICLGVQLIGYFVLKNNADAMTKKLKKIKRSNSEV